MIPRLDHRKSKNSLEHVGQIRKCSKNDREMSKGHRSQEERFLTDQALDNLNIKINGDSNEL